jgi:CheY-like chemotaxis protein
VLSPPRAPARPRPGARHRRETGANIFRRRPPQPICYDPGAYVRDPKTIVIVEDDEGIRETMAALLEDEGYSVRQAANGEEGLASLRAHDDTALVLLDLWMPVMNGWQMLEAMRADPELRALPVVVISAAGELPPPAGAQAFLKKPVRLETLLDTVKSLRLK